MTKIKYLGINLTKHLPCLYVEYYEILMKETQALSKWRHCPCVDKKLQLCWEVCPFQLKLCNTIGIKFLESKFIDIGKLIIRTP